MQTTTDDKPKKEKPSRGRMFREIGIILGIACLAVFGTNFLFFRNVWTLYNGTSHEGLINAPNSENQNQDFDHGGEKL